MKYWEDRAIQREEEVFQTGEELFKRIEKLYANVKNEIEEEIEKLYKKVEKYKDSEEAYLYRIKLARDKKKQIKKILENARNLEVKLSGEYYTKITNESYSEIFKGTVHLNEKQLKDILKGGIKGINYSKRIWKNMLLLEDELNDLLAFQFAKGVSSRKIAEKLAERMQVSLSCSKRLVRTESNYFHNQGTLESYKDYGITHYKFLAKLDNRTSKICESLNGEVYEVEKAKVGINYPPMHPNCRSTTIAVIDTEFLKTQD